MGHTIRRSRWRVTLELPTGELLSELVLAENSGEALRRAVDEYRMRTGLVARPISATLESVGHR